ncbi:hypothetical protein CHPG_00007 [Cellulophaga phage phi3:1]|nr:hypothetical protein CHPG_00007 [Cellulophaga phage phi3:1]
MRTIKNLALPQDSDYVNFPDGRVRNETVTAAGTPVVEEVYGDLLQNFYKIIRSSGLEITETADSEGTQFQLLDALKIFANEVNDLKQTLTVNQGEISTLLNLDTLPDDYVFIGKITEDISANNIYLLNGTGEVLVNAVSTSDVKASSLVLVVLSQVGYSSITDLTVAAEDLKSLSVSLGTPLSFNSTKNLMYFSDGKIITDYPKVYDVQQAINDSLMTSDFVAIDCFTVKEKLLCYAFNKTNSTYHLFSFLASNPGALEGEVTFIKSVNAAENKPLIYTNGQFLFITNTENEFGDIASHNKIGKYLFDEVALEITLDTSLTIESSFFQEYELLHKRSWF